MPAPARSAAAPRAAAPRTDASPTVRRNLPLLLLQARERLVARFRPILNEYGLTEQQFRVLRAISVNGPLEPRQICSICHISSPSLAGVMSRMEAMGLINNERLAHDQRRVMVSLTATSRAKFRAMQPQLDAVYESLEADLGTEFVSEVYTTLDRLISVLR